MYPDENRFQHYLFAITTFETCRAYFCLSDGKLHPEEFRMASEALGQSLAELCLYNRGEGNEEVIKAADSIVRILATWGKSDEEGRADRIIRDFWTLNTALPIVKSFLYDKSGFSFPSINPDGTELLYRESVIRWRQHFCTLFLMKMSDSHEILEKASESNTIVVIGDIRSSQDLMTYAKDSQSFVHYMFRFIEHTRRLIDDNLGIFDKFTGDGFIAYFNQELCAMQGRDYRDCFLEFVRGENIFSASHFLEWRKTIRKLPDIIGLSMGADIGRIFFHDIDHHFMAVGDAIVWAKRMADFGVSNEIVVNNLLYAELEERSGLSFEEKRHTTKSGEMILTRIVSFKE